MKQIKIQICVIISFFAFNAQAGDFGLGLILFGPTGLSASLRTAPDRSVDAALAIGNNQRLYIHSTYLWHRDNIFNIEQAKIDLHYGIGGRIISWNGTNSKHQALAHYGATYFAARAPVGLSYTFKQPQIQVFGELALSLDVAPVTDADVSFGLGARYYF